MYTTLQETLSRRIKAGYPLNTQTMNTMKHCPITGLPVTEKSHWTIEHQKGDYTKKISLIGTDILHAEIQAEHDVTLEHVYQSDVLEVVREQNLSGKPLYIIIDCSHVIDFRYSYKREFTNLIYSLSPDFRMMVLYNSHPDARLQLEMFQSLVPQHMPFILADSYQDALTAVLNVKTGKVLEENHRDRKTEHELFLKKEFLASIARMLWLKMFDQHIYLPPEDHMTYPYFKVIDFMQRDLKAMELEHEGNTEQIMQECRARLTQQTTALKAQIELNKKNSQQFKEEKTTLLSRISSESLESTRISTAASEKTATLTALCGLVDDLDIDPGLKQTLSTYCVNLVETGKREKHLKTELTEADSAFISKLQKKHPNLSQRELRISLLIKLDYNSRDIARTMGLSVRGIESIRYRLHKKTGLDKHRSLKTYLSELSLEL
jgi:DNA-binding CsgD family transcriptional regulator